MSHGSMKSNNKKTLLRIFLFIFLLLLSTACGDIGDTREDNVETTAGRDASKFSERQQTAVADCFAHPMEPGIALGLSYSRTTSFLTWSQGAPHPGEDWDYNSRAEDAYDPIYAAANGIVSHSDFYSVWGNIVTIDHTLADGSAVTTQYAHLHERYVEEGTPVSRGQQIGTMGRGEGDRYFAHLHFEIRTAYRDPDFWPGGWTNDEVLMYWANPSDFIATHPCFNSTPQPFVSDPGTTAPAQPAPSNSTATTRWKKDWLQNWHCEALDGAGTFQAASVERCRQELGAHFAWTKTFGQVECKERTPQGQDVSPVDRSYCQQHDPTSYQWQAPITNLIKIEGVIGVARCAEMAASGFVLQHLDNDICRTQGPGSVYRLDPYLIFMKHCNEYTPTGIFIGKAEDARCGI